MIRSIFELISFVFKTLGKGLMYIIKGISWYFTHLSLIIRDISNNNKGKSYNKRYSDYSKKKEIF